MVGTSPGQRVYLVRLACGDGVKNPEPLADFVVRIKRKTGASYDPSAISRLENGKRKMDTDDAVHIAAVDPKGRGPSWLAFGLEPAESPKPRQSVTMRPEIVAGRGSPSEPITEAKPDRKKKA